MPFSFKEEMITCNKNQPCLVAGSQGIPYEPLYIWLCRVLCLHWSMSVPHTLGIPGLQVNK